MLTHEGSINIYSIFKMIRGRVLLPSVAVPRAAACKTAIKLYMLPPIYFIRHSVAKK